MLMTKDKIKKIPIYIFFLFYFSISIQIFKNYGIDIEEHTSRLNGFYWINYISKIFYLENLEIITNNKISEIFKGDPYVTDVRLYNFYGPAFEILATYLEIILNIKESKTLYELRHLLIFIFFYLSSIAFFYILFNRFKSYYVSFFGLLVFILNPRIFGNSFHNTKDIIFLAFVVFATYFMFKLFNKIKLKYLLFFSLFAALATSTRIIGVFLPLTFIILNLVKIDKKKIFLNFLVFFLYFFFLFIHWPFLWESPIHNFANYLIKAKSYIWNYPILFDGNYHFMHYLPRTYLPVWMLITIPVYYIGIFFLGFFLNLKRIFNRILKIDENKDIFLGKNEKKDFFIFFSFTTITSLVIFSNTALASSWRHLFFLNFFISYICSYYIFIFFIKKKNIAYRFIFLLPFLFIVYKIVLYHPFESLFFNELSNLKIKNSFEVDQPRLSRTHALEKILEINNRQEKKKIIKVANASFGPLYNGADKLRIIDKEKFIFLGQDYNKADYIYNNFIYEFNPKYNSKYTIPKNFDKIYEFNINSVKIYEIYKKK